MEGTGTNAEDDHEINSSNRSSQVPIESPEIFEIALIDSLGGSKTIWDKPTITKEELQLFFPDTLGGIVDNQTRRPVREDAKLQAFVLKNNHSYEIRISGAKSTKAVAVVPQTKQATTTVRENSSHNIYEDKENFLNGAVSDAGSEDESEDSYDREDYGKKMNTRKRKSRPLESISLNRSTPKDRDVPSFSNETSYTWSELIEEALRTLGGKRTGQEITSYIEENYSDMLSNKTKTWKNSVMGCLSSNARKLWIKEATVVDGKKRFVWCLKNDTNIMNSQKHTQDKDTPSMSSSLAVPQQTKQIEIGSPFAAKALSRLQRGHSAESAASPGKTSQSKVKSKLFKEGQVTSPTKASLFLLSSLASSDSESNTVSQKTEQTSTSPKRRKLSEDIPSIAKDQDDEEDILHEGESDEECLPTPLPDNLLNPQEIILPVH